MSMMTANLSTLVSKIRAGTSVTATGISELASGNGDLSQRTEQQASALEDNRLVHGRADEHPSHSEAAAGVPITVTRAKAADGNGTRRSVRGRKAA
jgi:hypothetical protein